MILKGPGKISIMVGGQVVGMAKEAKFSIAEDDASTKDFSDPWRTPDIKQSWDISCDAMVRDAGDVLRDLLNGLGGLYWYSELDDVRRNKIVERANEIYNK